MPETQGSPPPRRRTGPLPAASHAEVYRRRQDSVLTSLLRCRESIPNAAPRRGITTPGHQPITSIPRDGGVYRPPHPQVGTRPRVPMACGAQKSEDTRPFSSPITRRTGPRKPSLVSSGYPVGPSRIDRATRDLQPPARRLSACSCRAESLRPAEPMKLGAEVRPLETTSVAAASSSARPQPPAPADLAQGGPGPPRTSGPPRPASNRPRLPPRRPGRLGNAPPVDLLVEQVVERDPAA